MVVELIISIFEIFLISANFCAVKSIKDGSFFLPLLGTGAKKGLSVSIKILSNGKVLNLAYGGTTTVNEIFYGIRTSLSAYQSEIASLEPEYMGKRKGDILHSHADISRVKKSLDFSPTTDLQEGLNQTIAWYVEMDTR